MLKDIVDNIEQCGQQNIVQCCIYQPRTGLLFLLSTLSLTFSLLRHILERQQPFSSPIRTSPDEFSTHLGPLYN